MHTLAINYIIFSGYLMLLLLFKNNGIKMGMKEYIFIILSFISLMMLHIGVEVNSVEDLPKYEILYLQVVVYPFNQIFSLIKNTDYFWAIFCKMCSYVTKDFIWLLFVYNSILIISHFSIAKRYSPYIPISIVIFMAISYNQSLFVLRQYLAISFLLWSIPCIINKRIIPYLILCIIAFYTHSSSIIWFPIYFIYNIKNKRLFIATIAGIITMLSLLNTNIGRYILMFGLEFESYVDTSVKWNITAKLIPIMYLTTFCVFLKSHIFDEGINKLCFIALIIYAFCYLFAPPVNLLGRILKYYESLLFISVPITMVYMRNKLVKNLYLLSILILQGYLSINALDEFYFRDYTYRSISLIFNILILLSLIFMFYLFKNKLSNTNNETKL